jgi:hypothetical protein
MDRTNKPGGSGNTSFFGPQSRSSVAVVLFSDRDALGDALSEVEVITKKNMNVFYSTYMLNHLKMINILVVPKLAAAAAAARCF